MRTIFLSFLALAVCGTAGARAAWVGLAYHSPAGFSVSYPMEWWRADDSVAALTLISGGDAAAAGVIGRGQAGIRVFAAASGDGVYQQAAAGVTPVGMREMARRSLYLPRAVWPGCTHAALVMLRDTDAAPDDATVTSYFTCALGNRKLALSLTQWEADSNKAVGYQVALRMLATLQPY